jgi:hypothetical protein
LCITSNTIAPVKKLAFLQSRSGTFFSSILDSLVYSIGIMYSIWMLTGKKGT